MNLYFIICIPTLLYADIRDGEPEPVGAGCFWLLGSRSRLEKNLGAGAAKKLALREDKKHKEIVLLLLFFG